MQIKTTRSISCPSTWQNCMKLDDFQIGNGRGTPGRHQRENKSDKYSRPCPPPCLPAQHPLASLNPALPTTGPASSWPPQGTVFSPSPGCWRGPGAGSDLSSGPRPVSHLHLLQPEPGRSHGHAASHPSQPPHRSRPSNQPQGGPESHQELGNRDGRVQLLGHILSSCK